MKNYFLLVLLLMVSRLPAQIVNIPDANFKNKLISLGIDTNSDGEIQQAEALVVTNLDVSDAAISDLTGIAAFTNIDTLICYLNSLDELNLGALTNLKKLDCSDNALNYPLTISPNNLRYLNCSNNTLHNTDIDFNLFPNLEYLDFKSNFFQVTSPSLDFSNLTNLIYLDCGDNILSNLDVSSSTNLQTLKCGSCSLSTLLMGNLNNLKTLYCPFNQISTLALTPLINLRTLSCQYNPLTTIDVNSLINLRYLDCFHTFLTSLDVSNLTNLHQLYCMDNQLQTLDVSNLANLDTLDCSYNSTQFTNLSIKNGSNESYLNFSNNPTLQYICGDVSQLTDIQQKVVQYGLNNVVVNSFCSFSLGGNHNTVSGKAIYDADVNGCTPADSAYSFLMVEVTNGIDTGYTYTDFVGLHTTFVDTGTYSFTPQFQNPAYFSANPVSQSINFPNNNNNLQTQDFCITPNGIFPDVEIVLSPIQPARPGFYASYKILFHNKGTSVASGNITFNFMGNNMNVSSTSLAPITQTGNQLTWNYSNLLPFETRSIMVYMNILPPTTNNIGDSLTFMTNISLINDANIADNDFTLNQILVGAFDPNDKTCLEGNYVANTNIGDYLHYLVRFQNTGTFYAEKVVVIDSIDATQFDISSLQMLETSHLVQIQVIDNVVEFYFDQIMLPDSFTNEPASHGYILFKIKTKSNLPFFSIVKNKAEIYFDYNEAVITNTETVAFYANCLGFTANSNTQMVTCYGACDGEIYVNVTGGAYPYSYQWSNGTVGANINGLCAGIYQQSISDAGGCSLMETFVVSQPTPINIIVDTVISALNNMNGAIEILVSGGTSPYNYQWSNGQITQNAMQLSSGIYSVTITDAQGCDTTINNILVLETVGTEDIVETSFNIFPNPTQNHLTIQVRQISDIMIFNTLGEIVISKVISGKEDIDISHLAKGIYWVKGNNSHVRKVFMKE